MLAKLLFKQPILIIGLSMFLLFIFSDHTSEWLDKYTNRFKPNICNDAKERLEKDGPQEWNAHCDGQDLVVEGELDTARIQEDSLQKAAYRELANNLAIIAKTSNSDTMILLKLVSFRLKLDKKTIVAYTSGNSLVQLSKLKDEKAIAFHIHTSVKVKEVSE